MDRNQAYRKRLDQSIDRSSQAIKQLVIPIISGTMRASNYVSCETIEDLRNLLDYPYGIDYIQYSQDGSFSFLSTRVQYDCYYPTITLRYKNTSNQQTEFEKRCNQFQDGDLQDWTNRYYSLHAYVAKDLSALFCAYVVNTAEVVSYVTQGGSCSFRSNPQEGNVFVVINIQDLRDAGIRVLEFHGIDYDQWKNRQTADIIKRAYKEIDNAR